MKKPLILRAGLIVALASLLLAGFGCGAQKKAKPPTMVDGEVQFVADWPVASSVNLAGTFNGWDASALPMVKGEDDLWRASVDLPVGYYEYKYVVDGEWLPDPANPASVVNNYGEKNSAFYVNSQGKVELRTERGDEAVADEPPGEGTVYLALVWHQHQPYYLDASKDQLIAPWVRTHITKDYYDMTAMLLQHPDVHVTVNLTPVLLHQVEEYYVNRIGPFYDPAANRIRAEAFLEKWGGRTDPWIDLMLRSTLSFGPEDDAYLFRNEWSAFSISRVVMARWPEYEALSNKPRDLFTVDDKRDLKCFFYLANFDPDFLRGPVQLVTGKTVDLSDLVTEHDGPTWTVGRHFTEDDANRLVAEMLKIAEAIIPLHREMRYDPDTGEGQVEVTTTPYFHPILPLLVDVHAGQSADDQLPDSIRFTAPKDAWAQVKMAGEAYQEWFGAPANGMWPAEGSVSEAAVDLFAKAGVHWIATGDGVLAKSTPTGMMANQPFRATGPDGGQVAMFFRDTELSDLIGFKYQRYEPEAAAEDLVRRILRKAPKEKGDSRLLTILLDGENAWEWYEKDPDAKQFLHAFYRKLGEMQAQGRIVTVTPGEYLVGNPDRDIPAHPLKELAAIDDLWPGSWIRADFSTWVGEDEENRAWAWLAHVRNDLVRVAGPAGASGRDALQARGIDAAWQAMYAAEGSDWFWWYGQDQNTGEGDTRWDDLYRAHLEQVYRNLQEAGFEVQVPGIPSLMDASEAQSEGGGAMTPGE